MIGGGFTGLSTALHLREAGVDVAIVEAAEPGWGTSARNIAQVIPTLSRPDPEDIIAKHGEPGERFVGMLRDNTSYLFDVTSRYKIDAEGEQAGWIQPAHSPGPHQDRRTSRAAVVEVRRTRRTPVARADARHARL